MLAHISGQRAAGWCRWRDDKIRSFTEGRWVLFCQDERHGLYAMAIHRL